MLDFRESIALARAVASLPEAPKPVATALLAFRDVEKLTPTPDDPRPREAAEVILSAPAKERPALVAAYLGAASYVETSRAPRVALQRELVGRVGAILATTS